MQKLQDYWTERSSQQKAVLVAAFLTTFLAIAGFAWVANRPSMSLLYGGLDSAQAGEVVAGIERAGVAYEVRGDSIWVDAASRDKLRMELAAQGLMAPAGLAAIELAKQNGSWSALEEGESLTVPDDLAAALDANPAAKAFFAAFPPSTRKYILHWIGSAGRGETRRKRIEETVSLAARNVRARGRNLKP